MSDTAPSPGVIELGDQLDLIDGNWAIPALELDDWIEDPNTGARVQPQRATDAAGLDAALAASWRVHRSGEWQELGAAGRAERLVALGAAIEARAPRSAQLEAAESGATISITSMLSFITHAAFGLAGATVSDGVLSARFEGPTGRDVEVDRFGWGPAVLLTPWNAPAPMAAHKAASALAAGCPVIIKPPERAPHGTAVIAEAAMEVGLPAGVIQFVHGGPEVGAALIGDPRCRVVSFTGGTVGGRAIAHQCAEGLKPVQLELGGHSPLVILPDADLDAAATAAVSLISTLNGQWCRALGRIIVPAGREAELLAAVLDRLSGLALGHSLSPESQMGPLVARAHLDLLRSTVARLMGHGGTAHSATPLPTGDLGGGNWLAPTLITGLDPALTRDEIFGPVASVHPYDSIDDALALANGTDYGLEAYVVGTDTDVAMDVARRIVAGGVKVNGASPMSLHLMAPRPAWGISGLHDEGTIETIRFFGGNRTVGVEGSL